MHIIKPHRKAVFLDVDGTIVFRDGTMPGSTKYALERAAANGHEMVLCTGRSPSQVKEILKLANFRGCIASAGANVKYKGKLIWAGNMDNEYVSRLVNYFCLEEMAYFLQAESGIYTEQWCMDIIIDSFQKLGRSRAEAEAIFGTATLLEDTKSVPKVEKCCYFNCKKPAEVVQEELGDYYQIVDSSYRLTRFCDGEICRAGVNKATGMQRYLEYTGIPHEDSIAFGDGPNDFEMVEYAATGVCMGNGVDGLKLIADKVCRRIEEDGLYEAFREMKLI